MGDRLQISLCNVQQFYHLHQVLCIVVTLENINEKQTFISFSRRKYKSVINFKSCIILFRVKYRKPLLVEGIDQLPLDDAAGKNHGGPLQSSNKCFFCQKSVGKKKLCYEI